MKLYGSTTSPYVRRLRLCLDEHPYEFINLQFYDGPDRQTLAEKNPTLKVPALQDGDLMVFDSRVIHRYLSEKYAWPTLSWQQQNLLTLIDAVNDSLVQLFILTRSEIDVTEDKMYFRLQRERIHASLLSLDKALESGEFVTWDYPSICLYCLLDWGAFREVLDVSGFSALHTFYLEHQQDPKLTSTDPRL